MLASGPVVTIVESVVSAIPAGPAELRATVVPLRGPTEGAVSVVLVSERALEASRIAVAEADAETTADAQAAIVQQPEPPAPTVSVPAVIKDREPPLQPGDVVPATLSFYYCEEGPGGLHPGDGGGFCGVMRDGTVVYEGAAACAYAYLGQQFRVIGDPLGLIYRCADTGSAVHGQHRDIWFHDSDAGWSWQLAMGQQVLIEILP